MWLSSTAFLNRSPSTVKASRPLPLAYPPIYGANVLNLDSFRLQRQGKNDISKALQFAMEQMNYGFTLIRPDQEVSLLERLHPQDALEHLQNAKTVVFGDSHGNALKLIEDLVMLGMLEIADEEAYLKFLGLYEEFEKKARPLYRQLIKIKNKKVKIPDYRYTKEMGKADKAWVKGRKELAQAKRLRKLLELVDQAVKVNEDVIKQKKIILVGDEINDRGPSDFLLLKILKRIRQVSPNSVVVNLSNHAIGLDFYAVKGASKSKNLKTLATERKNFLNNPVLVPKGLKNLYNTRSMGETYRLLYALPDDEEKTKLFKEYQDLLREQYESHTLIHQEGHVVTTHAFVSQATEKAWRHFLHRLDAKEQPFIDTPLREQSGEAYQKTIAKINALTKGYLIYKMVSEQKGTLEGLDDKTLKFLGTLISRTANEREKPFHPPMIHGGFRSLEEAGFVPPADLCNGKTPHRIYGHTGKKNEPANNRLDLVRSEEPSSLKTLLVSCLNHTSRQWETLKNLFKMEIGVDGKPHKKNPIVIIE